MSANSRNTDDRIKDFKENFDETAEKGFIACLTKSWFKKVNEINKKYREPRLKMTPLVRAALLALRLYLIMLVIILVYKFYTLVR